MRASRELTRLIDSAAPYWAGEAEVFATYFRSKERTRESDRGWLALQCFKEIWGAATDDKRKGLFLGPLERLAELFPRIDTEVDRHEVLDIAQGLAAEFAHYCAFADVCDALALPGEPKIDPASLYAWRTEGRMPGRKEDDALTALRFSHIDRHGKLGQRALRFTEGGYCTLFSEGMKLGARPAPGHAKADALIARACARVYDDEFGHMLLGIVGLDDEGLSEADWKLLGEISLEQLRARIRMRNAQFGKAIGVKRLAEILAGKCQPLAFDYERAKLAA